jgi:type IV pilus assembly protein PilE
LVRSPRQPTAARHALAQKLLIVAQARSWIWIDCQVVIGKPRESAGRKATGLKRNAPRRLGCPDEVRSSLRAAASGKRANKMRRESQSTNGGALPRAPFSRAPRGESRAGARTAGPPRERGFTLIELMVTVVVIAILTAVAYPSYQDYVRRGALSDATSTLSDVRVKMEQFYQDNRTYDNGGGACGVANPAATQHFSYACALAGPQAYTFTATGNPGLTSGFVFTINHQNVRATTGMHASWGALPGDAGTRWVLKKP